METTTTTTPTDRKEIESMFADAALLFSTGHVQEASLRWHGVVSRLVPMVTADLVSGAAATTTTEAPSAARLRGEFWVHPHREAPSSSLSHLPSSRITCGDRTFALYASAIRYVAHPGFASSLDDDLVRAATSVFNLGLCHHLQALLRGGNREASNYAKALRAYGASLQILEGSGLCFWEDDGEEHQQQEQQQRGVGLLQLALANNIGHIHDQMHAHDGVLRQLEVLHRLLWWLDPRRRPEASNEEPSSSSSIEAAWSDLCAPFLLTAALYPDCLGACHPAPCA
jgi:hypothetical protein